MTPVRRPIGGALWHSGAGTRTPSARALLPDVPERTNPERLAQATQTTVTNQTVVARGPATLDDVRYINSATNQRVDAGAPELDTGLEEAARWIAVSPRHDSAARA